MTLPTPSPDRSAVSVEGRHPDSARLHAMSVRECVELMERDQGRVARAIEDARPAITAFIEAVEPGFVQGGRLVYVGAGSSGRLGVLDASECPPTFHFDPGRVVGLIAGGDAALRRSSESREDDPRGAIDELESLELGPSDAVLGIAAGGTTPYVVGAIEWCVSRSNRPIAGLLTCSTAPAPKGVHAIALDTGPEVLAGSTRLKAGTATKVALNIITTTLAVRSGCVYQNLMVDLRATNAKLVDRAARIVRELTGLDRDKAIAIVSEAGGSVKAAIVMARLSLTRERAESLLRERRGRLDLILDA